MEEIKDFFSNLFETAYWPARWHCGYWSEFHGWIYILSDLSIWAAYFTIPIIIIKFVSQKSGIRFYGAYFWFAAFILTCGFTHLLDAIIFWYPIYRFSALLRFVTALISWFTIYYLIKMMPMALSLKTPKQLEHEVTLKEELLKEVGILNEQLNSQNIKLIKANSEMEHFNYILSHDLQEPLRKIQVFSNMIIEKNSESDSIKYLQKIDTSAKRMKNLIQDVLSYSKADSPNEAYRPVDLNQVLDEVKTDFELAIDQKKATIIASSLPEIEGIKYQINQIFYNLIGNSLKYSTIDPVIEITYKMFNKRENGTAKDYLELKFSDNGIGFDTQYSDIIFQPFKRLQNTAEYEGTGIGLALVKKIVESHNGTIKAESTIGQGSIFTIILPVKYA